MPPLSRAELDKMSCDMPDCDHKHDNEAAPLFLHARCHLNSAVEVEYLQGILMIRCALCKHPVVDIAVAESFS